MIPTKAKLRKVARDFFLLNELRALRKAPLDAEAHFLYGKKLFKVGASILAYAEFRTAEFLGKSGQELNSLIDAALSQVPEKLHFTHNQFLRYSALSEEISELKKKDSASILDVGGGDGRLSLYLKDCKYCLAEPSKNGISGADLPLTDRSVDYAVACHVFEHIPTEARDKFLNELLRVSSKGVILLNPFRLTDSHQDEALELIVRITGSGWAKEHLACGLPNISSVTEWARQHSLSIRLQPKGNLLTAQAIVMLNYFAKKAGEERQLILFNRFYNSRYAESGDSEQFPDSVLVTMLRDPPEDELQIEGRGRQLEAGTFIR